MVSPDAIAAIGTRKPVIPMPTDSLPAPIKSFLDLNATSLRIAGGSITEYLASDLCALLAPSPTPTPSPAVETTTGP